MNKPNFLIGLKEKAFLEKNTTPIWMASRFFLKRNLSSHHFPLKMSPSDSENTLSILKHALMESPQLETPVFFKMEELKTWEREYVLEHFLTPSDSQKHNCHSGMIMDQSGNFLAVINGEDHLVLHAIDSHFDWQQTWKKFSEIEIALSQKHVFAYSHKFGYLTSDISYAGTGLTVQAFLHIPALIHLHQIDDVLSKELHEEVKVQNLTNQDNFIGDIAIIQNRFTLGLTEDHILEGVHKSAYKLMNLEKELRLELSKKPQGLIVDKVSRAIGLLMHSYQIETKEALAALSFIKLGLDLKWISGISNQEINALFLEIRRAHLMVFSDKEIPKDQLPYKRAAFLQKVLKPITMTL